MAELGTVILESGGEYPYMKAAFGRGVAFIYSWTYCLLTRPAAISILCQTCSRYLITPFFDDGCGDPPRHLVVSLAVTIICKCCHHPSYGIILRWIYVTMYAFFPSSESKAMSPFMRIRRSGCGCGSGCGSGSGSLYRAFCIVLSCLHASVYMCVFREN